MTSVLLATQLTHKVPQFTGGHVGDAYALPAERLAAPSRCSCCHAGHDDRGSLSRGGGQVRFAGSRPCARFEPELRELAELLAAPR